MLRRPVETALFSGHITRAGWCYVLDLYCGRSRSMHIFPCFPRSNSIGLEKLAGDRPNDNAREGEGDQRQQTIAGDQRQAIGGKRAAGGIRGKRDHLHHRHGHRDAEADDYDHIDHDAPGEQRKPRPRPAIDETRRRVQPTDRLVQLAALDGAIQQKARQPNVLAVKQQLYPNQEHEYADGRRHTRDIADDGHQRQQSRHD